MTPKQLAFYCWTIAYATANGHWPTVREGMEEFSYASTNSVRSLYGALQGKGLMAPPVKGRGSWRVVGYRFKLVADVQSG